jgi:PucR C-terminal helix-turn-helix domain/GGDEF-like domain
MTDGRGGSLAEIRGLIVRGVRAYSSEIEQAIGIRIDSSVPHLASREDPDYESGLQEAITAVVGYSLDAIEKGPEWSGPIPPAAAAQARRAARVGVGLATIQRRYIVGHRELGEFVARETERAGFLSNGEVVHHLRRTREALLEYLLAAVELEYSHERESMGSSRRSEIVQRLLSGESVEPAELAELDYEIDTYWHLGLIASGEGVEEIIRRLKRRYGCKCLQASLNSRVCAWLGMQQPPNLNGEHLSTNGDGELSVAIGEPGRGLDGWRLTHHQARAAFAVALRRPERVARYADSRLLAAALQNETLARSLTHRYLVPLGGQSDGGAKLRRTLRTYIDSECNATSASHGLRVGRHTVESRVRTAERLIGATLRECLPELDVALRLGELSQADTNGHSQRP